MNASSEGSCRAVSPVADLRVQNNGTVRVYHIFRTSSNRTGFILSDNHGEIPYQVGDDTLFAIAEAVKKYGTYPIIQK